MKVPEVPELMTACGLSQTQAHCGISTLPRLSVGRDSSVGIATLYGLDGPGIESRSALGPTQRPLQRVLSLSRGVKRPGCGFDHPTIKRRGLRKS